MRTRILSLPLLTLLISSAAFAAGGDVIKITAKSSATDTVNSLKKLLEQNKYTIYSVYGHGDEESVKQVISFGKAKHNARIMWHDPAVGLELPLKLAVFQNEDGTQVIYRKPSSLRNTYSVQNCRLLDKLDGVMAELARQDAQ